MTIMPSKQLSELSPLQLLPELSELQNPLVLHWCVCDAHDHLPQVDCSTALLIRTLETKTVLASEWAMQAC